MKRILIIILSVFLFLSCGKSGEQGRNPAMQQQARPFPTVKVERKNVESYTSYPTRIVGQTNSMIRPKIVAYVQKVLVEEGTKVRRGQPLFQLETKVLTENAIAAKAQVEATASGVEIAKVEVEKLTPLVEKSIISEVQLQTAKTNLMMAKARLGQAKATYQGVVENINFSIVRSPVDGIIGKINFREGSLVSPQDPTPMTTVSDARVVYAYITFNEKEYLNFFHSRIGKTLADKITNMPPIALELADGSIYAEKGTMRASTGQLDPATGTIQFRIDFKNDSGLLSNGSTGKIRIPLEYKNALVVPETAVVVRQGVSYIYKVVDNVAKSTIVVPLDRVANLFLVKEGVQEGEELVGDGILNLRDGMPIVPQVRELATYTNIGTKK